jgi:phosphohistidine phosphatase
MELLLIRHAIAFERDRSRWPDDALRPLTGLGEKRMQKAATGLHRLGVAPARVLVSPLVRARRTAEILADEARWPDATVIDDLAPGRPPAPLFAILAARRAGPLAVVGHEPDLGYLLAYCLGIPRSLNVEFRKGGVACVGFADGLRPGRGELKWLLTPRVLRALTR